MKAITKHLKPNVGAWTIIGLLVIGGVLFLSQSVGALPAAEPGNPPAEPLAPAAASQTVISYQGTLTDKSGNPLNQTVTMEFALYDAATGGNRLWGPETQSVAVSEGLFHVLLGSVAEIDPVDLSGDLYLNIKVNGEQLTPREQMTNIVYSVGAERSFSDFIVDGNVGVGVTEPGARIYVLAPKDSDAFRATDENGRPMVIRKSSSDNLWHFRTGDGFVFGEDENNNLVIPENGKIGIGTSNPTHGQMQIDTSAVPLAFRETDQSGGGSLWRLVLDSKQLRFDASQDGSDFDPYISPLTMYANGSLGCNGLIEANLQTPEEHAAGGNDRFEKGDLLCWGDDRLEKCAAANDRLVQAVADMDGRPIVIGAEVVKVLGPVKRGDILVASDVPGYAMVNNKAAPWIVIAQALEDFDGERGRIKAMIRKM